VRAKIWDVLQPVLFFFLCMITVTLVGMGIASLATNTSALDSQTLTERVKALPLYISSGYYVLVMLLMRKAFTVDQMRFGQDHCAWKIWQVILAVLVVTAAGFLWSSLLTGSGLENVFTYYKRNAAGAFEGQNPWILLLATVLLGPPAEEMIFRGMVYRRARYYWGTPRALVLSSLLFGLYHGNMIQFLYALGIGLLLGWIYEKSGSLKVCIAAHMCVNLLAVFTA
jgi:membrane protease YdiL (CAAX protease family)